MQDLLIFDDGERENYLNISSCFLTFINRRRCLAVAVPHLTSHRHRLEVQPAEPKPGASKPKRWVPSGKHVRQPKRLSRKETNWIRNHLVAAGAESMIETEYANNKDLGVFSEINQKKEKKITAHVFSFQPSSLFSRFCFSTEALVWFWKEHFGAQHSSFGATCAHVGPDSKRQDELN